MRSGDDDEEALTSSSNQSLLFPSKKTTDNAGRAQRQQLGSAFSFPVAPKHQGSTEKSSTADNIALHNWSVNDNPGSSNNSSSLTSGREKQNVSSASPASGSSQRFLFPVSPRSDSEKATANPNINPSAFSVPDQSAAKLFKAKPSEANSSHGAGNSQSFAPAFKKPAIDVDSQTDKSATQGNNFGQFPALPLSVPKEKSSNLAGWSAPVIEFPPLSSFDSDGIYHPNRNTSFDPQVESYAPSEINKRRPSEGKHSQGRRVSSTSEANMSLPVFEPMPQSHLASPYRDASVNQKREDQSVNEAADFDELSAFQDNPIEESVGESLRRGGAHKLDQADSGKPRWWKLLLVGIVVFVVESVVLNLLF